MLPDERAFRADIDRPEFRLGEIEERWKLLSVTWPNAIITVTAADGRKVALRFDCSGFPDTLPTAGPWDVDGNARLDPALWPKGKGGRLGAVFNPAWKQATALYLPCDREAIAGHEHWRVQMPSKIWRPADGVVQYLEQVHELLNCRDYTPA